jgi:PAS domain S-box-containing protein
MKVCVVSDNAAFTADVKARFDEVGNGFLWVSAAPSEPMPVAGLLVFDGSSPAHAPVVRFDAPRWLLCTGAPPTDLAGWDAVMEWPIPAARLAEAIEQARHTIRARSGIAGTQLLASGMRRILELASESIELTDTSVRLLYVNPAFEQITGWLLEDAVGSQTGELFRAGTHDPAYYAEIMATLRRGEVWRGPLIGRRRNDALSFQEATLAPLNGPDGKAMAFVAIKRDLARDTLTERALESRETRLQTMLEGAGDGVLVHDDAGLIADANSSASAMLGVDQDDLLAGCRIGAFFEGYTELELVAAFRDVVEGAPITLEGNFRRADGQSIPVSLRIGAFLFGGERFLVTLARDVSERVELERRLRLRTEELDASLADLKRTQKELVQREKLSALGTLVAGVAHEVNTPLGVALTALSLADEALQGMRAALNSPTPSRRTIQARMDELDESMKLALQNGRRAATLVADFKKIAVDQASEALRQIDLGEYLQSILSSLSPMLRKENVVVLTDLSPIPLRTRPGAIAQVVSNLIQNAVTHAFPDPTSDRQLWVRCQEVGGMAQMEIEDRGAGIDPVTLKAVFDPFVTTRMGGGGSGLGMYVVHNLVVEVLNGTVEVESEVGRGTRVRVRIPLKPEPHSDGARSGAPTG